MKGRRLNRALVLLSLGDLTYVLYSTGVTDELAIFYAIFLLF